MALAAAGLALVLVLGTVFGLRLLDDDTNPGGDLAGSSDGATSEGAAPPASPSPAPSEAAPRERPVLPLVQAATSDSRTPATARTAMEQLFAGRALVTTRLMRATLRGDEVIASAAGGVLAGTGEDVAAVTRVYRDEPTAAGLERLLSDEASAAVAFADAARAAEPADAERAGAELDESSRRLGTELERLTGGAVPASAVAEDAGQLRAYVDAEAAGDHAAAYAVERQLQMRRSQQGAALATALAGPVDPGTATPQQQELTAAWQLLFGEHAVLAGDVVRAGLTGADDFPAATRALDANTQALTAAVGGVVPPDRAGTFATLWADQIDGVVGYARATAGSDEAGQAAAQQQLSAAGQALTAFFSEATGGRLDAAALGPAFERHAQALQAQAQAWSSADAGTAYELAAADYAGLASLAAPAADAFAQTVAAGAPVGGAATGQGGTASNGRGR